MNSSPNTKPRGYFERFLAVDSETTGLSFDSDDASDGHQALSWGLIVSDVATFKPIEQLYVEVKWNEQSRLARKKDPTFGKAAEKIHGLTFEYLEENGMDEEEAVTLIGNLIIKYWGPINQLKLFGHNVHLFDLPFLRSMFRRHGIELPFGNRHYDTNSLNLMTIGGFSSDDLFATMGFKDRDLHNSLEDIRTTLDSARKIKELWNEKVNIHAYK